mmetsp:Transcript_110052/g.218610  ORF Transcript_110052/g.218610 Transcript_110052/m.218610 type:complete len:108 (+) Transcript_110052:981-1304(+)
MLPLWPMWQTRVLTSMLLQAFFNKAANITRLLPLALCIASATTTTLMKSQLLIPIEETGRSFLAVHTRQVRWRQREALLLLWLMLLIKTLPVVFNQGLKSDILEFMH